METGLPLPPVLRIRKGLVEAGECGPSPAAIVPLPKQVAQKGTTYTMAQSLAWLDDSHFVVGRWDGSISIFNFETAANQGPIMTAVVGSPAMEGVQMLAANSSAWPNCFVSSNDNESLTLWSFTQESFAPVPTVAKPIGTLSYDASYGMANSGVVIPKEGGVPGLYIVVGHASGFLTIWEGVLGSTDFTLAKAVGLSNKNLPNSIHNIRGVTYVCQDGDAGYAYVITGSEDRNLTVVRVPDGEILKAVSYNESAKCGINSVAYSSQGLLVANCAVGKSDKNLWYYSVDAKDTFKTWDITLVDSRNLVNPDTSLDQVFNFGAVWGGYRVDGQVQPCWFASTQEGRLWMGTATTSSLKVIGSEVVSNPLGAALGITPAGKLAFVAYNVYQFLTM